MFESSRLRQLDQDLRCIVDWYYQRVPLLSGFSRSISRFLLRRTAILEVDNRVQKEGRGQRHAQVLEVVNIPIDDTRSFIKAWDWCLCGVSVKFPPLQGNKGVPATPWLAEEEGSMVHQRKILILTAKTGGGHLSLADALRDRLQQDYAISVEDLLPEFFPRHYWFVVQKAPWYGPSSIICQTRPG